MAVARHIALAPPAAAAERRPIARAGPHRPHDEMEASAFDPDLAAGVARTGHGRVDPGNAHAAAVEIEAMHVPAAAAARIDGRAGRVDLVFAAPEDHVGALLRWPHLHALAVEPAIERHAQALGRLHRAARHCRDDEKAQSRSTKRENAHVAPDAGPEAGLAIRLGQVRPQELDSFVAFVRPVVPDFYPCEIRRPRAHT